MISGPSRRVRISVKNSKWHVTINFLKIIIAHEIKSIQI
jgi:hypothetical protein